MTMNLGSNYLGPPPPRPNLPANSQKMSFPLRLKIPAGQKKETQHRTDTDLRLPSWCNAFSPWTSTKDRAMSAPVVKPRRMRRKAEMKWRWWVLFIFHAFHVISKSLPHPPAQTGNCVFAAGWKNYSITMIVMIVENCATFPKLLGHQSIYCLHNLTGNISIYFCSSVHLHHVRLMMQPLVFTLLFFGLMSLSLGSTQVLSLWAFGAAALPRIGGRDR